MLPTSVVSTAGIPIFYKIVTFDSQEQRQVFM